VKYRTIANSIRRGELPQGYEIQESDVGHSIGAYFGFVQKMDVGKRVWYRKSLVMENNEQRDRRMEEEYTSKLTEETANDDENLIEKVCDEYGIEVVPATTVCDVGTKWEVRKVGVAGCDGYRGLLCCCATRGEVSCFLAGVERNIEKEEK